MHSGEGTYYGADGSGNCSFDAAPGDPLVAAMNADFGRRSRHETLLSDVMTVLHDIDHAVSHLKRWMKPTRVMPDWTFLPATAQIRYQPVGVVGIISPWNYPVNLALMPLADAPTQVLMVPRSLFAPGAAANGSQEMPRISADQVRWFSAAPCFVFHFVNAYEDARGQVVIDGMRVGSYPHFAAPAQLVRAQELVKPTQRLTRFVIDPAAPAQSRAHEEVLSSHPGELPRTHPQHQGLPYRYGYAIGAPAESPHPFLNCILRYDTVEKKTLIRDLGAAVPGEPVMVPRAAAKSEDDGYVLTLVYDGKRGRSLLYVLDARDLSTVAVAMLPHHVPPGFHGNFVPSAPPAAA